ncbi:MAG: lycopene cyclase family protein, partial [Rubrobacteraceae bacterium]
RRLGERAYAIGMLGGESRPSTGYTFLRIQRYCHALATELAAGKEPPTDISPRRLSILDAVFLRFMRTHPERCPGIYTRMFAGVPTDSLVRFLTEKSTIADEASLIEALPKTPFVGVAGRMLFEARHAP